MHYIINTSCIINILRKIFIKVETGNKQNAQYKLYYINSTGYYIGIRVIIIKPGKNLFLFNDGGEPVIIPLTAYTEEDKTQSHY